jgi:hypothetical protein
MVHEGEPAPYTGDLYPIEASIKMALAIDTCRDRTDAKIQHLVQIQEVERRRLKELAVAESRADKQRIDLLQTKLDDAGAWYRSPPFVAAVSATVAVAALLASTVLVQSTAEVWR